jgi:hypothetical protein
MLARTLLVFLVTVLSSNSYAVWLNTSGNIATITTYAHTNTILVSLSNDGHRINECSSDNVFAISSAMDSEARSRMYSMLLAAKSANKAVTISYSDVGNCEPWDSNRSAYRRIVRLSH